MDDPVGWAAANPAMGRFRSSRDIEQQAKRAMRIPTEEASFRNLVLNQRVAQEGLFIAPSVWKSCNGEPDLRLFQRGYGVTLGLDLSAMNDLTAAVLAAEDDDRVVHLLPFVFCPASGIKERALRDKAPYDVWVQQGKMIPLGGKVMDYDQIVSYLFKYFTEHGITVSTVEFDRWRIDIFKKYCADTEFLQEAEWRAVGQGFKDFSPRCAKLRDLLLSGKVRHGGHALLNMAAANAVEVKSPAGDGKLDKSRTTARIDPLVAAVMAAFAAADPTMKQADIAGMMG